MIKDGNFSQEILTALDSFFAEGRCPHAMLIDGGGEKQRTELARLAAKMIVCSNQDITPCGACENCRKADENIHPDIITVTKPDDRKFFVKNDVKKVVADAYLTPNDSLKKVYILSEVQQMNEECQNLLLKSPGAAFIAGAVAMAGQFQQRPGQKDQQPPQVERDRRAAALHSVYSYITDCKCGYRYGFIACCKIKTGKSGRRSVQRKSS